MDAISTGDSSGQQAMQAAMVKKSLEFDQAMTAQIINGSLQKGAEVSGGGSTGNVRTAGLQAAGIGQNIDTVA